MKIMSLQCRPQACRPRGTRANMRCGMQDVPAAAGRHRVSTFEGDFPMQWQTPTATDFRFGFEITMYVSAR
jgi:coenzyme PQQ precursor peptide PqqA